MMRPGLFLFVMLSITVVMAQDADCPNTFQAAVERTHELCADTPSNQVCYGNPPVQIQPRANVRLVFAQPGDQVDMGAVESLTTSAADNDTLGLAFLNARGNFPNSSFTMIAFGSVTLQNESHAASDFSIISMRVTAPEGANVRELPSTDAYLLQPGYDFGDTVIAYGRLEDSSWIRLGDGWVRADLVESDDDISLLNVLPPDYHDYEGLFGPMQDFSLTTGTADSPCAGAPESGLLVQATHEETVVQVNGWPIVVSGTAWLQSDEDGLIVVSVLEGTAGNADILLNAGEKFRFGYLEGDWFVGEPETYDYVRARNLPLLLLPRQIELPFSTGGLITSFEPGTGFLNTIPADGPCTVAWTVDINLRAGPGTNYPIRQGVSGGYYAQPDARAVGTDGRLWWRLAEDVWLAADNTAAGGACGTLPLVEAPPTKEAN